MNDAVAVIEYEAARVLMQLRSLVRFALGVEALNDEARAALLALGRFEIARVKHVEGGFEPATWRGRSFIRVRADLGQHGQDFACAVEVARRQAGDVPFGHLVAEIVGGIIVSPTAIQHDAAAKLAVMRDILALGPEWRTRVFDIAWFVQRVREAVADPLTGEPWLLELTTGKVTAEWAAGEGARVRQRGPLDEAAHWYHRAGALAWEERKWKLCAESFLVAGTINRGVGRYGEAESLFGLALEVAQTAGMVDVAGRAHHDLFALGILTGNGGRMKHATAAMECYGAGHPALCSLASDMAVDWQNSLRFAEALLTHEALLRRYSMTERHYAITVANRAVCLAALGRERDYKLAWDTARALGGGLGGDAEIVVLHVLSEAAANINDGDRHADASGRWLDLVLASGGEPDTSRIGPTSPKLAELRAQGYELARGRNSETVIAERLVAMLLAGRPARSEP